MRQYTFTLTLDACGVDIEVEISVDYAYFPAKSEAHYGGSYMPPEPASVELLRGMEERGGEWVHSVLFDALPIEITDAIELEILTEVEER